MRLGTITVIAATLSLGACARGAEQPDPANADLSAPPVAPAAPIAPPEPGTPGGLPDDRTPLNEPNGPIDPKSVEAAGQVVQLYAALIEEKKFAEAEKQWSDPAGAKAFSATLQKYSEVHLQIGKPGDSEGAAGSIYVTVPVVFYGRGASGPFNPQADVNLRRVNDVDGSTAAQRRWHIANIEWAKP
ncbi:MAG: hypothetical protein ABIS38_06150 [Sphingomicrobium sp.]